jgi:hypothetical protein
MRKQLEQDELTILDIIRQYPGIHIRATCRIFEQISDRSWFYCQAHIRQLEAAGYLRRNSDSVKHRLYMTKKGRKALT